MKVIPTRCARASLIALASGLISLGFVKHYPAMRRDLERRETHPEIYAAYRQHVADHSAPVRYVDSLTANNYV